MAEWLQIAIGDLCDRHVATIQTGPFGSQLHAHEYRPTGTPVVPTEAIGRRHILELDLPRVDDDVVERLARHRLRAGDILFARRGAQATGSSAIVKKNLEGALCGTGAILMRVSDRDTLDPTYLSFALASPSAMQWLRDHAVGAVMPNLNADVIRRLEIPLPAIHEQRAIARILGSLDDKIELNRRMNETLDAMARALFESWFVDFDPVRAKMRGEQPANMDAATAALFPSRLVQTEHGEMPEGWAFDEIGNAVRVVGGSTPSTERAELWDGQHAWVRPKDLSSLASPVLLRTERTITDQGLATVSSGLLPVGSVLLSSRAPIGYLAVARIPVAINQGFIGMICDRTLTTNYVLRWTETQLDAIKARAGGTTFPEISKGTFRPMLVRVPSRNILLEFERLATSFLQRIEANEREAATLTELRDALLPKLLAGELRVPSV